MNTKALLDKIKSLESELQQKENKINELTEKVTLLEILHFGPKSEKWTKEDDKQALLFNEAEDAAFEQDNEESKKESVETIELGGYKRRKHRNQGRKPISAELPREEVFYDIPEKDKVCACGHEKTCIGEEVSERAAIKPAEVKVIVEKRKKYVCKNCEGVDADEPGVITAKGPKHLIPGSIADESLLAWSITEKFEFAIPLYRQEKRLSYIGMPMPRATLSNLTIKTAEKCEGLYELLRKNIIAGDIINADETRVQVIKEPERKAQNLSWMWVFAGGAPDKKCVIFKYDQSRSSDIPYEFLKGYEGWLQTDDYGAYATAIKKLKTTKIRHVLCWAHARRKFHDAWKATESEHTKEAIGHIKKIFELEDLRKDYSLKGFNRQRKNRAELLFEAFGKYLKDLYKTTPPQFSLGKAIAYTLDNWEQLIMYIDNPLLTPSNNIAENAIRPFVIGRKNWLFSYTPKGARSSAVLYSLIESAKLNKLRPFDYLYYIFKKLPYTETEEGLKKLLPFKLTPEEIKSG
jgi:transposase